MDSCLVGGGQEIPVFEEVKGVVGEAHVHYITGYCVVDFFLEALSCDPCVDIQGPELDEVGLDVFFVVELADLLEGIVTLNRAEECG